MASEPQSWSLGAEANCTICREIIAEPVKLECGHTFCRECIARYWETDETAFCPKCGVTIEQRGLHADSALEKLISKGGVRSGEKGDQSGAKPHCVEHQEEVKLFCETERKMICVNCLDRRDEKSHTAHNFMLLNEAVEIYKEKMNTIIYSLKQKKTSFQDFELKQQESISEIKEQSNKLQTLIDSEFSKLRNILDDKERNLVKELNEEKDDILSRMETNLREIRDNSQEAQQRLSYIEMQLNEQDAFALLMDSTSEEQSENDYQPKIAEGSLSLGAFKGPTQYRVWRNVIDVINPGCAAFNKGTTS
ncbi:zinc-binding protein A33-like [Heptranchias perlo]|uniref:zinc-binding protein A33-like n=1 Tax=Heptranchias perlo TaxID=212740 RepID=UPI003559AA7C